jgi:hypothetical protein
MSSSWWWTKVVFRRSPLLLCRARNLKNLSNKSKNRKYIIINCFFRLSHCVVALIMSALEEVKGKDLLEEARNQLRIFHPQI